MAAHDPKIRRLARVAANSRHSAVPYPHRPKVPDDPRARYEREVDPARQLEPDPRRKHALCAWRRDVALEELRVRRLSPNLSPRAVYVGLQAHVLVLEASIGKPPLDGALATEDNPAVVLRPRG